MNIIEALEKFNTINEVAKAIKGYSNGRINNQIKNYIVKYGYEKKFLQTAEEKYNNYPKKCKECNDIISYDKKDNIFCSSNCSAKFNNRNRGEWSDDVKEKISLSLKITEKGGYKDAKIYKKICEYCNNDFIVKRLKSGNISRTKFCSDLCRFNFRSYKSKIKMNEVIKEGRHKGWKSRNILSYPEKFFTQVLKNNNLYDKCKKNFPINKRDLGLDEDSNYFLDFYFEDLKIDLEIDGSQHKYRKEHDNKRDKLLKNIDIIVYRIKWKSINNSNGKEYIKTEIDKFLDFYNKIKIIKTSNVI